MKLPASNPVTATLARIRGSATSTRVALAAILLVSLLLSNYANIIGSNWVIHPDDHEAYVIGKNLKETGSLGMAEPLNELSDLAPFTPSGAVYYKGRVVPRRALGMYFIAAAGFFLGDNGPFYIIPLFGLMAMLFLFKTAKLMADEKKALLTTFLVALSAPFLYWNSMLYANVPALAFLLAGLYFMLRIAYARDDSLKCYLLATLFFGLAIWMRYEMLLILVLLSPVVIGRRRFFHARPLLACMLFLVLILIPLVLLNQALYGNPIGVGYAKSAPTGPEAETKKGDVSNIYSRFIKNYFRPDLKRVYDNAQAYLLQPFPMLLLAGALGLAGSLVGGGQNRSFTIAMLLVGIAWTYYVLNAGLWSGSSGVLTTSYFRYLLIVYVVLAIFAPAFLERFHPVSPGAYKTVVLFFVISFLIMQVTMLLSSPFGLKDTNRIKADFKRVEDFLAAQTPENAVVVASLYSKGITCRSVLQPRTTTAGGYVPVVDQIAELLRMGREVYIVEAAGHASTFLDLSTFILLKRDDMQVQTVALLPISGAEKVEKVVLVDR